MRLGIVCKVCGGDMYEIEDGIKCDICGFIIRSDFSEDRSEMITKEERLKELELEYEEFLKTDSGKKWIDNCINSILSSDYNLKNVKCIVMILRK